MTTDSNKAGPITLWRTLKGKKIKTNDGKDLGEIKDVSENYLHVEKGTVRKEKFWVPKYVADAFDGKTLWLLIDEEELRGKYQYGTQPPPGEQYSKEFESFKGTPYGQNANYAADFNENIRVVENYKNIRDLK
jgi:sporulation protein YlmC with PRC-barrel domain